MAVPGGRRGGEVSLCPLSDLGFWHCPLCVLLEASAHTGVVWINTCEAAHALTQDTTHLWLIAGELH